MVFVDDSEPILIIYFHRLLLWIPLVGHYDVNQKWIYLSIQKLITIFIFQILFSQFVCERGQKCAIFTKCGDGVDYCCFSLHFLQICERLLFYVRMLWFWLYLQNLILQFKHCLHKRWVVPVVCMFEYLLSEIEQILTILIQLIVTFSLMDHIFTVF